LSEVFDRILALVPMPMLGARARPRSVKAWLYTHAFVSWAGPVHGSWLYALAYLLGWMGVLALLYRRGIFIQI
jgi:predicted acyltransferase